MQKLKKYLALSALMLALPFASFIATHFVLESDKAVYDFIPQESDVVIEINTRNFINEIAYQRIYQEDYFNEKIIPEEVEKYSEGIGIDPFSSIIIFREQWAENNIWMALMGYSDQAKLEAYVTENTPDAHLCFGEKYVLAQLTPYSNQDAIDQHMKDIMDGKVKSFKERVDLTELFNSRKEINCYIIPQTSDENNQVLSGNLSFDFLTDNIKISGQFTPVSGFAENVPVAYGIDEEAAFSLRSSLNILSSIFWFSKDNIRGIPQYSQMAMDYNGMNMFMVHKDLGYTIPFKQYPDMQVHFDILEKEKWKSFFDTLQSNKSIKVDTVTKILSTEMGTFFIYNFNDRTFELMRDSVRLKPCEDEKLYFAVRLKVDPLLDNIKFSVDQDNPPSSLEQKLGLAVADEMIDEFRVMSNISEIAFDLRLEDETNMVADGKIQLKNTSGHSIVESMSFGSSAVVFMANYLSGAATAQ